MFLLDLCYGFPLPLLEIVTVVRLSKHHIIISSILSVLTIFLMRIFNPIDTAAAEYHLVLCQSSSLIREQVLDLTQLLSDVEGPALDPGVQLLVVQG